MENNQTVIPKAVITNSWYQPDTEEILVDDQVAVMSMQTFRMLMAYSLTIPSGAVAGRMWRRQDGDQWLLCWFQKSKENPELLDIECRPIMILDWKGLMNL